MSEGLSDPADSAVAAAVDVAAWAVEAAKEVAINRQDFGRAAVLRDVRRTLDRALNGIPEPTSARTVGNTDLLRVIPVNQKAGHVTIVSVELYAHETCIRYIDDRGFDRLHEREVGLADDLGATYAHHGGAASGNDEGRLRGDAYFRPEANPAAKLLRIVMDDGAVEVPI